MAKSAILFTLFFTIALLWAKQQEYAPGKTSTRLQEKPPIWTKQENQKNAARMIKMKVTAYCPCEKCCGKYADGKTSRGRDAWKTLGVAADSKLLAYNTKLEIPGVGVRIVDDTGGAMRQSAKKGICHIDVRFPSHKTAKNFGVQWLDVKILSPAE